VTTPPSAYHYLLLYSKHQISCGIAQCGDGGVPSVKVTVTGSSVVALLCGNGQGLDWSDQQAVIACDDGDGPVWTTWTGTRDGSTAVVRADSDPKSFYWGTITFAGTQPGSPAVKFTTPAKCERYDGTVGKNIGTGCQ